MGRVVFKIAEVLKKVDKVCESATEKGAKVVAARATGFAPKKTGALSRSITVKKSKFADGGHIVEAYGDKEKGKYYASFVELGTHKQSKQPFLRPALRESKTDIMRMFKNKI